jgi:hypothetical protein
MENGEWKIEESFLAFSILNSPFSIFFVSGLWIEICGFVAVPWVLVRGPEFYFTAETLRRGKDETTDEHR